MAGDAFMKVSNGIDGESTDDQHKKWIEIESISTGVHMPVNTASTSGARTTERANFSDITITKAVDRASPKLKESCYKGIHLDEVTIELCRGTGDKTKYLEYTLKDVVVSSYSLGGSSGSLATESVSLNPGEMKMKYIPTDPEKGGAKGNVEVGWSLIKNATA